MNDETREKNLCKNFYKGFYYYYRCPINFKILKSLLGQPSRGASFNARPEMDAFPREIHRIRNPFGLNSTHKNAKP